MTLLFQIYLVLLIIRPQEFLPILMGVPILQLLLLSCLGLWLFSRDKNVALPPIVLVGCFLIFAPLTVAANGWWGGVAIAHAHLDPIVVIFLVATMAARKVSAMRRYMRTIVVCACVLVAYISIQLRTGMGPWAETPSVQGRPYYIGIFSDPNDLGQLFIIALAFVVYLLAIRKSSVSGIVLTLTGAWLIYGVILTNSRGAMLATMAILALECWRRFGKVAVVVASVLVVPALLAVTRLSKLSAGEESAFDRLQAWYEGIQMLRGSPIFGVGFGNFTDHSVLTAHNSIILPMAELGIVGLTIWLGIIWYSLRMLWWVGFKADPAVTSGPDESDVSKPSMQSADEAAEESAAIELPDPALRRDEVLAGRGLLLALVGFLIGAFFLSQSYQPPLFLLCGFAVARFIGASTILPNAPHYRLLADVLRLGGVAIVAVVGMYMVVKVTL
jgi:putative inorganic carbon (hco3(-)) transporter